MNSKHRELVVDALSTVLGPTRGPIAIDSKNLFEDGLIDSFSLLELVAQFEVYLDVVILPEKLTVENFKNVEAMASLCAELLEN